MHCRPLFSSIPSIATGPILCLIGAVIFLESVTEIHWSDLTDAVPAFTTILAMPFTHNIAYGRLPKAEQWFQHFGAFAQFRCHQPYACLGVSGEQGVMHGRQSFDCKGVTQMLLGKQL